VILSALPSLKLADAPYVEIYPPGRLSLAKLVAFQEAFQMKNYREFRSILLTFKEFYKLAPENIPL
jgi:hypothetical protein